MIFKKEIVGFEEIPSNMPSTSLSIPSEINPDLNNDDNKTNIENNYQTILKDCLEVAKYKHFELRYVVLQNKNPEPWFFGPFAASQLGYKDCSVIENIDTEFVMSFEEIRKHQELLKKWSLEENVNSSSLFVNIAGLQYLIFKSKCPLKLEIQDWLQSELLPMLANKNIDNIKETEHKKLNEEEEYVSQLLKKLQITELELKKQRVKNEQLSEELQITKQELEKQRLKNQEREQHVSLLSEELQLTKLELEEENTKNHELEKKILKMSKRRVRKFRYSKNMSLEKLLCIMVKDPKQKKYDENRGLYYIPGKKRLDRNTPEDKMRFITIRGQKRHCKRRVKELVEKKGYEIVQILEKPDPVSGLNLLYLEPQGSSTPVENRDAFTTTLSNSGILKKGICIDLIFNIYYDKHIK